MSFKLNLSKASRSSSASSPRDAGDRPWDTISPRRDSDPQLPRSPRHAPPMSPRLAEMQNFSSGSPRGGSTSHRRRTTSSLEASTSERSPQRDYEVLSKMKETKTFILLRGSLQDIEIAQRVISGVYTTEEYALCGARKAAYGGDSEKYDIPDLLRSASGYVVLETPQDAFRKNVESRVINIDPL